MRSSYRDFPAGTSICVLGFRSLHGVPGGIESHCRGLYSSIVDIDDSARITLITRAEKRDSPRLPDDPMLALSLAGMAVIELSAPHIFGVDTLIHTFFGIVFARLRVKSDIMHLHGIGPGFFAPLARLLGFRTVVTHHARDYLRPKWDWKGRAFLKLGERFTAMSADRIVCVSDALRTEFTALYPKAAQRTVVVPNAPTAEHASAATDAMERFGLQPGRFVLAAGRLEATKNFPLLIEAFRQANPDGMTLVIAGSAIGMDRDHEAELRRQASDRVVFTGYLEPEQLGQLYRNAALFVHPSRMEGYGIVVAEALQAGVPVIASDIPAHREFGLDDTQVFAADDVERLSAMLADTDYRRFRNGLAIERQQANTWHRAAEDHLRLFSEILPPRSRLSPA